MNVNQAFEVSWKLYQKGIKHKIFKINGKWSVTV